MRFGFAFCCSFNENADNGITADLWKLLSNHMKQMYTLKAMEGSALVDTFSLALLNHDLENKRSQRKVIHWRSKQLMEQFSVVCMSSVATRVSVECLWSPCQCFTGCSVSISIKIDSS